MQRQKSFLLKRYYYNRNYPLLILTWFIYRSGKKNTKQPKSTWIRPLRLTKTTMIPGGAWLIIMKKQKRRKMRFRLTRPVSDFAPSGPIGWIILSATYILITRSMNWPYPVTGLP